MNGTAVVTLLLYLGIYRSLSVSTNTLLPSLQHSHYLDWSIPRSLNLETKSTVSTIKLDPTARLLQIHRPGVTLRTFETFICPLAYKNAPKIHHYRTVLQKVPTIINMELQAQSQINHSLAILFVSQTVCENGCNYTPARS